MCVYTDSDSSPYALYSVWGRMTISPNFPTSGRDKPFIIGLAGGGWLETMLLCEMGPQLKLPINVMKGSMPLQCNTYFPKILAI